MTQATTTIQRAVGRDEISARMIERFDMKKLLMLVALATVMTAASTAQAGWGVTISGGSPRNYGGYGVYGGYGAGLSPYGSGFGGYGGYSSGYQGGYGNHYGNRFGGGYGGGGFGSGYGNGFNSRYRDGCYHGGYRW